MDRILLTVDQAAQVLGVGMSAVYDPLRMCRPRSVRIGRSRRISMAACYELVEQLRDRGWVA